MKVNDAKSKFMSAARPPPRSTSAELGTEKIKEIKPEGEENKTTNLSKFLVAAPASVPT